MRSAGTTIDGAPWQVPSRLDQAKRAPKAGSVARSCSQACRVPGSSARDPAFPGTLLRRGRGELAGTLRWICKKAHCARGQAENAPEKRAPSPAGEGRQLERLEMVRQQELGRVA